MKIAVFGATGLTGTELARQALARGHRVRALVRDPARLKAGVEQIECVRGNVMDAAAVRAALEGVDAVVSALNVGRSSGSPWARLLPPANVVSAGVANIVTAMTDLGVRRLVTVSAHAVGDSWQRTSPLFRWFVQHSTLRAIMDDHLLHEEVMRRSSLHWTAVRPCVLTNGKLTSKVAIVSDRVLGMAATISRADVAWFMLNAAESMQCVGETPSIVRTRPDDAGVANAARGSSAKQ